MTAELCVSCEFNDCAECEDWTEFRRCCCGELRMSEADIAEERLRSRDYDAWSRL